MSRRKHLRKLMLGVMVAITSIGVVVGSTGSASAAGCHGFTANVQYGAAGLGYVYTAKYTVPSWSVCKDINVTTFTSWFGTPYCGTIRVHFYPSSGPDYDNGWNFNICDSPILKPIATNVANGTVYRIEVAGSEIVKLGIYD